MKKAFLYILVILAGCAFLDSWGNKQRYADLLDPQINKGDKNTIMGLLGPPSDTSYSEWEYQFEITKSGLGYEREPGSAREAYPEREFEVLRVFFNSAGILEDWEFWSYRSP